MVWWGQAFSTLAYTKFVSQKWKENQMEGVWWWNDKIAHVQCTWAKSKWPFFFFLMVSWAWMLPPLFFFFFLLISYVWARCSVGFFFFCLSLFFFNCTSFFNNGIWINLYKLIFSIISLFHSHFSIISSFFIFSLFHPNQIHP